MHERACVTMLHLYLYVCVCVVCTFCELSRFGYTCWQRTPDKLNQHIWRRHNNWAAESKDKWKLSSHTNVSRRERRVQAELRRSLAQAHKALSRSLSLSLRSAFGSAQAARLCPTNISYCNNTTKATAAQWFNLHGAAIIYTSNWDIAREFIRKIYYYRLGIYGIRAAKAIYSNK